jgi:hypothetical protein
MKQRLGDTATATDGIDTYEWVVLAPLLALLRKTRATDSGHPCNGFNEGETGKVT